MTSERPPQGQGQQMTVAVMVVCHPQRRVFIVVTLCDLWVNVPLMPQSLNSQTHLEAVMSQRPEPAAVCAGFTPLCSILSTVLM